ncbi:MAG: ATP-binding cassette domain-containing protein [Deltaproteobacteria bacterium]|nr:MAG: ATP-binding cassette domain-containing protein [Deltaproteobacteria bacterium]
MGRSGSGKSVLLRMMNGLMLPDDGEVRLFGTDTRSCSRHELMVLRRRTSTLFQNYALIDSLSVEENIAFPLSENTRMPRREIRRLVRELLDTLQLPNAATLRPAELSGGMKKRVSLARALITNPEVVLFDEPTTGLDPVMIEFVDDMLIDARRNFDITSVIISHDMASAFRLADSMAMIHDQGISFRGTPDEARQTRQTEVREFVESADSRLDDATSAQPESPPGTSAHAAEPSSATQDSTASPAPTAARTDTPDAETAAPEQPAPDDPGDDSPELRAARRWAMSFDDLPAPETDPVVAIRDVHKAFGPNHVLRGVNFHVQPRQITTLIGGSGSGKSVMMKHILGLMKADRGSVRVLGREMRDLDGRELILFRRRLGMLFQSAALFDSMTVLENCEFPLREQPGRSMSARAIRERAEQVMEKLHIADLARRMPGEVSGGQRKRIGLARAIVAEPDIMIFDEPTTGLDPVMTAYVNDMIVEAQETFDLTALVVSHDMASTFRISHRVAMLYRGVIIAFGTPDDLRTRAKTVPQVHEFIYAGGV